MASNIMIGLGLGISPANIETTEKNTLQTLTQPIAEDRLFNGNIKFELKDYNQLAVRLT